MKSIIKITGIIFLSVLMLSCSSIRKNTDPVRVLLITGFHDFNEEPFYSLLNSFQGITISEVKHPNALAMFCPENRASYDVILLYDMPEKISEQERRDFSDCLKQGKGLVVLHHAYCAYQSWSEYQEIVGGRYQRRAWTDHNGISHPASTYKYNVQMRVKVADAKHPITKGIQDFDIIDEAYANGCVNPDVHVLLTTDEPSSTSSLAWINHYEKTKVATILLGHDNQAWSNPSFGKLLNQAILWVR
jgi:type 1 glutamine amidotransferase